MLAPVASPMLACFRKILRALKCIKSNLKTQKFIAGCVVGAEEYLIVATDLSGITLTLVCVRKLAPSSEPKRIIRPLWDSKGVRRSPYGSRAAVSRDPSVLLAF